MNIQSLVLRKGLLYQDKLIKYSNSKINYVHATNRELCWIDTRDGNNLKNDGNYIKRIMRYL
jgi:hypothetical protein